MGKGFWHIIKCPSCKNLINVKASLEVDRE